MWTELDDAVARDDRTARNDAATEDDIHGHVRLTDGNWGERGRRRGSGKIDVPRRRHERYEVGANGRQTGRWVIDERSGAGIGEGGGAGDSDTLDTENDGAEGGAKGGEKTYTAVRASMGDGGK